MMPFHTELLAWIWRPYFPIAWVIAISVVAAAMAVFAYLRIGLFKFGTAQSGMQKPWAALGLLFIRLGLITLLTVLLLGPSRIIESETIVQRSRLFILADVSESMLTEDIEGKNRFSRMTQTWLSSPVLGGLRDDFYISVYAFAEKPQAVSMRKLRSLEPADGQNTNLVFSTREMLNQFPQNNANDVVLLLSDGIDSEDAQPSSIGALATAKNLPINTVVFGSNSSVQDAAVVAIPMQEFLYPNESGTILAKIYQVGCSDKQSVLKVRHGDDEKRFPIRFQNRDVVEVEIPIQHDKAGQYQYELSLEQVGNEVELRNNIQNVFALVHPQRMQVLIIEGQPFWDTKFIAQSLRKDDRIELVQVSQITQRKRETIVARRESGGTSKVPTTAEEWSKFDVVILGRSIENVISPESAEALVENLQTVGGNLVFARGRACNPSTPDGAEMNDILSRIEPVEWGDAFFPAGKLSVTMSGKMTQWFTPTKMGLDVETALERFPGFQSCQQVLKTKVNARVLAEVNIGTQGGGDQSQPALVTSSTGSGSVVAILGEGIWRWSLLSPDNQDLVGFYDAFWSNMIRWLIVGGDFQPGQQISMNLSHSAIRTGDEMVVDVVMKHASPSGREPTLKIRLPDGSEQDVAITPLAGRNPRFRATIPVELDGVHELELDASGMNPNMIVRKFNSYSLNVERLDTSARPMLMRMIADETGGRHYKSDECDKFLHELKLAKEAARIPPRTIYIWDQAWLMASVLILAGVEWVFRRFAGLI